LASGEWRGELLEAAVEHGVDALVVHGDSQLVINQVAGDWSVGAPRLVPWYR
jgi:ribonuclease HI